MDPALLVCEGRLFIRMKRKNLISFDILKSLKSPLDPETTKRFWRERS
jgi:hypothetical protein